LHCLASARTLAKDLLRPVLGGLSAPHPFQLLPDGRVDPVADAARLLFAVLHALQCAHELAGAQLRDLLAGGSANGDVGGNETHPLPLPVLSGESLEERVRVGREADLEAAVAALVSDAVEDDDATRAPDRDVARERIDELLTVVQPRRTQDVVAVEQVQRRIRQRAASAPRTGGVPQRR
jgi:hypothetical protein